MSNKNTKTPAVEKPLFTVEARQYVSLTFTGAVWGSYGGPLDFTKTLSADEARSVSAALKQAAAELD